MNKLKEINGYVKLTLDKLPGIRADLVRIDEHCQDMIFVQFIDALRKWTTRNRKIILSPEKSFKRENAINTMTVFIMTNVGIKPVTTKQKVISKNAGWYRLRKNYVSILPELNIKPLSGLVIGRVWSAKESTIPQSVTKKPLHFQLPIVFL